MKTYLAAASLAAATLMASAANASVNVGCLQFAGPAYCTFQEQTATGNFGDSFQTAQSFTDTFTFSLTQAYELSFTMTNTAEIGGPISFTSLLYDSTNTLVGPIAVSATPTTFNVGAGSYKIVVDGKADASSGYTGTIDIKPVAVPAPATWGLMMVGIGALGVATRRRVRVARIALG